MNTLDWECPTCGVVKELSGFTSAAPPMCDHKRDLGDGTVGGIMLVPLPMQILWKKSRASVFATPKKGWDAQGNEIEFKSIADVRAFERENERKVRDGVEQPMIVREFAQDRCHRDQNSLGDPTPKIHPFSRSGRPFEFIREK